jgi:hypothetical protein
MIKLTQEEKFTRLATQLGWEPDPATGAWYTVSDPTGKPLLSGFRKETGVVEPIPDYFGSLDAVHEAEKVLTQDQQRTYWTHMLAIRSRDAARPATEHSRDTYAFMATATQRAEALGLTLNLWEQGQ